MIKLRENEEAVSPVIGVILMVAITVILAAVIAAFVFGMGSSVQSTKNVAVTAQQQGPNIVITYQGGADAQSVKYLAFSIADQGRVYSKDETGDTTASTSDAGGSVSVGTSWKFTGTPGTKEHVVVIAHFTDGSDQVVLDTFV